MAKNDGFDLRRGEPGQEIDYTDADGNARKMKATDEGVFLPGSTVEEAILDGFELPRARVDEADRPKRPTSRKVTRRMPTVQGTGEVIRAKVEQTPEAPAEPEV
jgi:hypothetical protein